MSHFRHVFSLILCLTVSVPGYKASAWDLDYQSVFETLMTESAPIDERTLIEYRRSTSINSRRRVNALLEWMTNKELFGPIDKYMSRFVDENRALYDKLVDRHVTPENVRIFYAEAYMLFSVIRFNRVEVLQSQVSSFVNIWERVDYRRLGRQDNEEWSKRLFEILSLAFVEAGPWSPGEKAQAEKLLKDHVEFLPGQNRFNFHNFVAGAESLPSYLLEPGFKVRNALTGLGTYLILSGGFALAGIWASSYNETLAHLPIIESLDSPTRFGLFVVLWFLYAKHVIYKQSGTLASITTKQLLTLGRRNYSYMLRYSPMRCEALLKEKQDE